MNNLSVSIHRAIMPEGSHSRSVAGNFLNEITKLRSTVHQNIAKSLRAMQDVFSNCSEKTREGLAAGIVQVEVGEVKSHYNDGVQPDSQNQQKSSNSTHSEVSTADVSAVDQYIKDYKAMVGKISKDNNLNDIEKTQATVHRLVVCYTNYLSCDKNKAELTDLINNINSDMTEDGKKTKFRNSFEQFLLHNASESDAAVKISDIMQQFDAECDIKSGGKSGFICGLKKFELEGKTRFNGGQSLGVEFSTQPPKGLGSPSTWFYHPIDNLALAWQKLTDGLSKLYSGGSSSTPNSPSTHNPILVKIQELEKNIPAVQILGNVAHIHIPPPDGNNSGNAEEVALQDSSNNISAQTPSSNNLTDKLDKNVEDQAAKLKAKVTDVKGDVRQKISNVNKIVGKLKTKVREVLHEKHINNADTKHEVKNFISIDDGSHQSKKALNGLLNNEYNKFQHDGVNERNRGVRTQFFTLVGFINKVDTISDIDDTIKGNIYSALFHIFLDATDSELEGSDEQKLETLNLVLEDFWGTSDFKAFISTKIVLNKLESCFDNYSKKLGENTPL